MYIRLPRVFALHRSCWRGHCLRFFGWLLPLLHLELKGEKCAEKKDLGGGIELEEQSVERFNNSSHLFRPLIRWGRANWRIPEPS